MTREEEIFEASKKISEYEYNQINFENGFINGAKWADKNPINVWHDVSEEPKGDYFILCDGLDNLQWVVCYQHVDMSYANWQDYVNAFKVNRWAYIKDLLPKGYKK